MLVFILIIFSFLLHTPHPKSIYPAGLDRYGKMENCQRDTSDESEEELDDKTSSSSYSLMLFFYIFSFSFCSRRK